MARRSLSLEIEGLEKWQRWLLNSQHTEVNVTKSRIVRSAGLRLLEHLDDLTPVRTGRLKDSMSFGDRDNVFDIQVGRATYVFAGTAVKYAQYINDGFTQKEGQFVPGYWQNGTFHYQPDHGRGMVLTGKVIPGAHMFEKSMDALNGGDLQRIMEYEFKRLYGLLFTGGSS